MKSARKIEPWREEPKSDQFLPYDVINDKGAYHIVFNLPENLSTHLRCSLSKTSRRLIVIVGSGSSTVHYPFSFVAPKDADLNSVRIQSRNSIHLISIAKLPREKFTVDSSAYPLKIKNPQLELWG